MDEGCKSRNVSLGSVMSLFLGVITCCACACVHVCAHCYIAEKGVAVCCLH